MDTPSSSVGQTNGGSGDMGGGPLGAISHIKLGQGASNGESSCIPGFFPVSLVGFPHLAPFQAPAWYLDPLASPKPSPARRTASKARARTGRSGTSGDESILRSASCGSKMGQPQNGLPWQMEPLDQNLRSPGGLILTHTQGVW